MWLDPVNPLSDRFHVTYLRRDLSNLEAPVQFSQQGPPGPFTSPLVSEDYLPPSPPTRPSDTIPRGGVAGTRLLAPSAAVAPALRKVLESVHEGLHKLVEPYYICRQNQVELAILLTRGHGRE